MTRTAQHFWVLGILVASLTMTAFGAIRAQTPGPAPIEADAAVVLAPLDDVQPALTPLLESARRYAVGGDAASREAFERALARFAEVRAAVERIPAGAKKRESGQLLDAVHVLVPRIHILALEIADIGDPVAEPAAADKLALLERLAQKTRAALDQLREAGSRRAAVETEKIARLAPGTAESVVPEGVAVLFPTVVCAPGMALFSSWRCLQQ